MNQHNALFAQFVPGHSPLHRCPAAVLLLLTAVLAMTGLFLQTWWVTVGLIALSLVLLASTGITWRYWLPLPRMVVVMVLMLIGYQLWAASWQQSVVVAGNFIICIEAARLVTLTQPQSDMVDALSAAARPLRWVGLRPERFSLAVTLMVRSIPYLLGSFHDVRDAARARGLERNLWAQIIPVVTGAVAYAQATGEALIARGLGEED